jgi:hypothetical protein
MGSRRQGRTAVTQDARMGIEQMDDRGVPLIVTDSGDAPRKRGAGRNERPHRDRCRGDVRARPSSVYWTLCSLGWIGAFVLSEVREGTTWTLPRAGSLRPSLGGPPVSERKPCPGCGRYNCDGSGGLICSTQPDVELQVLTEYGWETPKRPLILLAPKES